MVSTKKYPLLGFDVTVRIIQGDALIELQELQAQTIQCCVTSPPYWGLRDYGVKGQLGIESVHDCLGWTTGIPEESSTWETRGFCEECYVCRLLSIFREVRRVLRDDGTLWLNLGDSYAGSWGAQGRRGTTGQVAGRSACAERQIAAAQKRKSHTGSLGRTPGLKNKDLVGIPWRVAFALQADGWYLRSDIIWHKPSCMPESITDRPTKSHEYIFLLTKSERYYFDQEAVREPGTRYEWNTQKFKGGDITRHHGSTVGKETADPSAGRNIRSVWTIATQPFRDRTQTVHLVRAASGDFCGDTQHIVSPDCLEHGGLFDLVAMLYCDEREVDDLSRSVRIDARLGPAPQDDADLFRPLRAYCYAGSSLDCWLRDNVSSAMLRSKRIRKMVHALVTSPSCTPCDERSVRIRRTLDQRGFAEPSLRTLGSNTLPDDLGAHSQDRTLLHIAGMLSFGASCSCPAYRSETQKTSHFATFPPKLIEPCIKAGCPKGGTVLDPFAGAGTSGLVADRLGRDAILIELNPDYCEMARRRIEGDAPLFAEVK